MPRAAVGLCRQRLAPAHFNRAAILAGLYQPDSPVEPGFLDRACDPADFWSAVEGLPGTWAPWLSAHSFPGTRAPARVAALRVPAESSVGQVQDQDVAIALGYQDPAAVGGEDATDGG
jgi:hypothetical protein